MKIKFISRVKGFNLYEEKKLKDWIRLIIGKEKKELNHLEFIFVTKSEIEKINRDFLNHNYPTDIITFNKSFLDVISGEIYICTEIVKDNSVTYSKSSMLKELYRVIIHGVLHLIGFNDSSDSEKKVMRNKENELLSYLEEL